MSVEVPIPLGGSVMSFFVIARPIDENKPFIFGQGGSGRKDVRVGERGVGLVFVGVLSGCKKLNVDDSIDG